MIKQWEFRCSMNWFSGHWSTLARKAASLWVSSGSPPGGYNSVESNVQVTALSHQQFCVLRYPAARLCNLNIFFWKAASPSPQKPLDRSSTREVCILKELMCWNGPWAPALGNIPMAFMLYLGGSSLNETLKSLAPLGCAVLQLT